MQLQYRQRGSRVLRAPPRFKLQRDFRQVSWVNSPTPAVGSCRKSTPPRSSRSITGKEKYWTKTGGTGAVLLYVVILLLRDQSAGYYQQQTWETIPVIKCIHQAQFTILRKCRFYYTLQIILRRAKNCNIPYIYIPVVNKCVF